MRRTYIDSNPPPVKSFACFREHSDGIVYIVSVDEFTGPCWQRDWKGEPNCYAGKTWYVVVFPCGDGRCDRYSSVHSFRVGSSNARHMDLRHCHSDHGTAGSDSLQTPVKRFFQSAFDHGTTPSFFMAATTFSTSLSISARRSIFSPTIVCVSADQRRFSVVRS